MTHSARGTRAAIGSAIAAKNAITRNIKLAATSRLSNASANNTFKVCTVLNPPKRNFAPQKVPGRRFCCDRLSTFYVACLHGTQTELSLAISFEQTEAVKLTKPTHLGACRKTCEHEFTHADQNMRFWSLSYSVFSA